MQNTLVSVIVPVYKVKKYLNDFFSSITTQTYTNLEIIIIDDCSPDESGQICDNLSQIDNRIRIIHKSKNEGVSAARNTGLDIATGDYIYFMDPDDIISPYLIETLIRNLESTNADISLCHELAFKDSDKIPEFNSLPENDFVIENNHQYLMHFCDNFTGPIGWPWNKLYKKSIIDDIRFKDFHVLEDVAFNAEISVRIRKAVWSKSRLYGYRIREDSITTVGADLTVDSAKSWMYTYNIFKEFTPDFADVFLIQALKKISLLRAQSHAYYGKESEMKMKTFFNDVYDSNKYILKHINKKDSIKLFLARYAFNTYYVFAKRNLT